MEIKDIYGKTLLSIDGDSLRDADLRGADLRDADLRGADLRDADLRGVILIGADFRGADLRGVILIDADLREADLRGAELIDADLRGAILIDADLRGAILRGAALRGADLSYAITDKRYIQISCIGSEKRRTTYCFDDDIVLCGCFKGSLNDFEEKVKKTHKDNEQYLKEYLGFIEYIKTLKGNVD